MTTLKNPAAVREARNVEPDEEAINPSPEPANVTIHRSMSRSPWIIPNSF
jgi:hypothetical protein